jgi:D-3-phosphoglycerate dehydrogenase
MIKEIKVAEGREYKEYVSIIVKSAKQESSVSAIVVNENNCRIVEINGMDCDVEPEGKIIVLSNIDKPGIIGKVGTILGEHNINIAKMFVARKSVGGEAVTFINVDNELSSELLEKIKQISGVKEVKFVNL